MAWRRQSSRYDRSSGYGGWAPYVPVAERRRQAAKKIATMTKKGEKVSPVFIDGRTIANTFWGKSWCENLESYSDFENRLPRGRTYVRNGSVVDLKIAPGKIQALVSGSSLYKVEIGIMSLENSRWQKVLASCTGKIDSLLDLLQGKLSKGVMETVTSKEAGLFPTPQQITLKCSCPDYASMCKHVAAALYGVGSRLDHEPEMLFRLRDVDHLELIAKASTSTAINKTRMVKDKSLETNDLGSLFGIEMDLEVSAVVVKKQVSVRKKKTAAPKRVLALPLKKAKTSKPAKIVKKVKGQKKTQSKTNRH
ncbi:MAG: SWIM zinc finger family protein [Proteobacteria bacterium]|nr:SWIM zinc finger family protein [Pseudomonadota bacterium]